LPDCFREPADTEAAAGDLIDNGFDRADGDLLADTELIREGFCDRYKSAEYLVDTSWLPRMPYVAPED
jgi:hypothetical protein